MSASASAAAEDAASSLLGEGEGSAAVTALGEAEVPARQAGAGSPSDEGRAAGGAEGAAGTEAADVVTMAGKGMLVPLRRALAETQDPDATDEGRGATALQWASLNRQGLCVDALLDAGADVARRDGEGQTAFHWAVIGAPDTRALARLLQSTAVAEGRFDPHDARDNLGYTPYHVAAQYGNDAGLAMLVAHALASKRDGPPPWCSGDASMRSPMHWAAFKGHANVANLLALVGCPEFAVDNGGLTPLHWACARGAAAVVNGILEVHVGRHTRSLVRATYAADAASDAGQVAVPRPPHDDGAAAASEDGEKALSPAFSPSTFRTLLTHTSGEGLTPHDYLRRLAAHPQAAFAAEAIEESLSREVATLGWRAWDYYEDGAARATTVLRWFRLGSPSVWARALCATAEVFPWRIIAAPGPEGSATGEPAWQRAYKALVHRGWLLARHPKVLHRCVLLPLLVLAAFAVVFEGPADGTHSTTLFLPTPRARTATRAVALAGAALAVVGAVRMRACASRMVRAALSSAKADRLAGVPGTEPLDADEAREHVGRVLHAIAPQACESMGLSDGGSEAGVGAWTSTCDVADDAAVHVSRLGLALPGWWYHHPLVDAPVMQANAADVLRLHAGLALLTGASLVWQLDSLVYVEPLSAAGLGLRSAASHRSALSVPAVLLTTFAFLALATLGAVDSALVYQRRSLRDAAYHGGV